MAVMRQADAILAGSAALYFFLSTLSHGRGIKNFNIFAPFRTAATVVSHLQSQQGYAVINALSPYGAPMDDMDYCLNNPTNYQSGVREVTFLVCGEISVEVITSGTGGAADSLTVPLGCQWTTLLMGFIGANGFCIPYPIQTLAEEGIFHVPRISHPSLGAGTNLQPLNKYLERGFQMFTHGCPDDQKDPDKACDQWACPNAQRWFGDGGCLVVLYGGAEVLPGLGTRWKFGGVSSRVGRQLVFTTSEVHAPSCRSSF